MKDKVLIIPSAESASSFAQYPDGNERAKRAVDLLNKAETMLKEKRMAEEALQTPINDTDASSDYIT